MDDLIARAFVVAVGEGAYGRRYQKSAAATSAAATAAVVTISSDSIR
jgi:hypothetical protein